MTMENFWFEAILINALILANGFFAASEIAVIAIRKSRIDAMLDRGIKCASIIARLKNDPDRFLPTVQIGVTVVGTFASAIGGAAAIAYLEPQFAASPIALIARWSHALALLIVVLPISYLSLVFGELTPAQAREEMAATMRNPAQLESLMSYWASRVGTPHPIEHTVELLTGHAGRTFEQWLKDNPTVF